MSTWIYGSDARFIYDGWNVVAEVELHGAAWDAPGGTSAMDPRPAYVRRSWVWGEDVSGTLDGAGGVGGLLVVTRHARGGQGRESYWAMSDLNGNVTGLVSTTSGRMAVYEYDAFGRLLRENEPEPGLNPVRFSSKYQDVETGLVYYGYRYYAPEMGRWISRDPIEEQGGVNLYRMVGNDAVNRMDILGLYPPTVISALGSAYSSIARSGIAKLMGVQDAIDRLITVAASKDEEIGGLHSRASAGYSRFRGVFVLGPSGINTLDAVHEATHAFEGMAIGSFASTREGHAHAMAHLYNSSLAAYRILEKIRDEDFESGADVEHWQYFWQTYALGRLASTGRVFGAEFKFGSEEYSWVESNLGARLSCNAIAKFMNDKFGSKHCVRFMCSSPDSGSVADDYSGSRRIYLINSIPEYFK